MPPLIVVFHASFFLNGQWKIFIAAVLWIQLKFIQNTLPLGNACESVLRLMLIALFRPSLSRTIRVNRDYTVHSTQQTVEFYIHPSKRFIVKDLALIAFFFSLSLSSSSLFPIHHIRHHDQRNQKSTYTDRKPRPVDLFQPYTHI